MPDKKPKGAKTAYIFFSMEYREQLKNSNPDLGFAEASKVSGEKWKSMTDKEKRKYVEMAQEDKDRHAKDMEGYKATEPADKLAKKGKRKAKDPNEPKRPLSAFFIFSNEFRAQIKKGNPDMKIAEVAKELGRMWSELKDKSKYEKLNEEAKQKYNEEMENYKSGNTKSKKAKKDIEEEVEESEQEEDSNEDSE